MVHLLLGRRPCGTYPFESTDYNDRIKSYKDIRRKLGSYLPKVVRSPNDVLVLRGDGWLRRVGAVGVAIGTVAAVAVARGQDAGGTGHRHQAKNCR